MQVTTSEIKWAISVASLLLLTSRNNRRECQNGKTIGTLAIAPPSHNATTTTWLPQVSNKKRHFAALFLYFSIFALLTLFENHEKSLIFSTLLEVLQEKHSKEMLVVVQVYTMVLMKSVSLVKLEEGFASASCSPLLLWHSHWTSE